MSARCRGRRYQMLRTGRARRVQTGRRHRLHTECQSVLSAHLHIVLGVRIVTVAGICRRLSSVTLHGEPAGSFNCTGQAMTSCHLQSNYSSTVTLHGGSVVLHPVMAIPCFNNVYYKLSILNTFNTTTVVLIQAARGQSTSPRQEAVLLNHTSGCCCPVLSEYPRDATTIVPQSRVAVSLQL